MDHHQQLRSARGCSGFSEELGTKLADSHHCLLLVCQCYGLKQCSPDYRKQLLLPEPVAVAECWKRKTNWKSLLLAFFSLPHHFPSLFCNAHKQCHLKLLWIAYHPCFTLVFFSEDILMSYHMHAVHLKKNPSNIVSSIWYSHFPYLPCPIFTTVSSVFQHCFRSYFYSCISNSKSHLLFVLAWQINFCMQANMAGDFQPYSSYLSIKETRLIYSYNSLSAHIKYKLQTWQINVILLHQFGT